jgi:hypothetical protein
MVGNGHHINARAPAIANHERLIPLKKSRV